MRVPRLARIGVLVVAALAPGLAGAQESRAYRVGAVHLGGPYAVAVDGLRDGLKELGLEDGKQVQLHVRDVKGALPAVEAAARSLEHEKVDVLFSVATSVTMAASRATTSVPIVFYAGTDPVAFGLVQSFRKPAGRLTGVHGRFTELTAKRLQLLAEMLPRLRRAITFYNPANPAARESVKIGRDAARQLRVELVERHVASVDELRAALQALRPGDADAFFYVADAMMTSQAPMIIDIARTKRLPTMFADRESAARGALASYGVDYYSFGRLAAKHVQRILLGASPGDLPVEQLDRFYLAVNLKTAKALGLVIPPPVLLRADEVIE